MGFNGFDNPLHTRHNRGEIELGMRRFETKLARSAHLMEKFGGA